MIEKRHRSLLYAILATLVVGWLCLATVTLASVRDRTEPIPKRAQGIDVIERLGARLPGNLTFIDQDGHRTTLADALGGGVPTIVTMNYSSCPMLCSLQLDGLVRTLKQTRQIMGSDYRVVTISYDPNDTPEKLQRMRLRYVGGYGRSVGPKAWTMLAGMESDVRAAAEALGIRYTYNEERKEYLHPAVIVLATTDGRIARYLYGLELDPKTVQWSMAEASSGKTMRSIDRLLLFCFHYDSNEGKYAPVAFNIMRVGAVVTVLLLGSTLATYWLIELRQRKRLLEVPPC